MAYLNLAVLEDQKDAEISPDAQKPTNTTQDAGPSASAPEEQTYVKIPSCYAENSAARRPHPTGTGYRQVMSLMTLGTIFFILLSIHTHTT